MMFTVRVQHFVLKRFIEAVDDAPVEKGIKSVLTKLCNLYAVWSLNHHVDVLYQGVAFYKYNLQ